MPKNSDPIFWPDASVDESLRQTIQKNYTDCINILQTQWYEADVDQRFCMSDQDIWGLIFPGVATYRRKMFNFNIINPIIQAISGQQRQNRKSTVVTPVHASNQKTSDQLTKVLYHIHKDGAYQVYSDCFEQGALIQGLGFLSIYRTMVDDPISGDIKTRYIDMKSCLFDPYFRKRDMSDCRFFHTRQFFDKKECALLYSEFADQIMELPPGSSKDDRFYYMPEVYQIQFPNLVAFDEYWYLASREAEYMIDIETEECQEFNGDIEDKYVITKQFNKRIKFIKKTRPTVRRTIILNDKVLVDEPNPYGLDRYSYVPCVGYFSPDTAYYAYKFRGVVRDMRDAQYLFNRRKVADLDILESQQQGLKVRQGALVTPDDGMNAGNGRMLVYKKDAQPSDIEQMQIVPPSPVMLQMEEMLMNVAYRIAGIDPAAMGIEVDDKAGIISMMRQAATARNLQRLFDQFDEFQQLAGDIMCEMVQKLYTYGKVKQIIGEEPTAEFDNKAFFKYGCKVVQAPLTETQQQLELAQILHLRELFGDAVPADEIIECMTIQNKDRIIEKITKNQQAVAQQQQKMEALQMKQIEVDIQTKLSYAEAEKGLAAERFAKIRTDVAIAEDKLKRAHQEDTHSMLNVVRTLKELQGMDLDHVSKQLEMILSIKEATASQESQQPIEVTNG